jgi:hypothetical protein
MIYNCMDDVLTRPSLEKNGAIIPGVFLVHVAVSLVKRVKDFPGILMCTFSLSKSVRA